MPALLFFVSFQKKKKVLSLTPVVIFKKEIVPSRQKEESEVLSPIL